MIKENDLSMLTMLAHAARKDGLFSLAERMFQHLSYAYPLRAFPHIGLGLIFFDTERHAKACSEFEKAIEIGEKNKEAYFAYGLCLFICGRYKESVDALHEAMEMDKKDGGCNIIESAQEFLSLPELKRLHQQYLDLT